MGLRVGICGVGSFSGSFIALLKAHPLVEKVVLCDLDETKLREKSRQFELPHTAPSLDKLLQEDIDAVALFTQNWLHGPQAIQALKAGKHVYSAVPSAITMDEITALVRTVEETGLVYMIGETSYYYPCTVYCRERFRKGDFGQIVFAEAEYYHDFDHGLYDVMRWRGGEKWKEIAGSPPMFYPTHSVSMVVSVTGAHATHVSCMGFVDKHKDGLFAPGVNRWNNTFSNETALCRMSDGSVARFNEFRRIGHPGTVRMSLHGTDASYEEQANAKAWMTKDAAQTQDLLEELRCGDIPVEVGAQMNKVTADDGTHKGVSRVHDIARLPNEYRGLGSGHEGSHQFLIDDFVKSCVSKQQPPNHVWAAARYLVPGLIAHESALQGGALLAVPDFGPGPKTM